MTPKLKAKWINALESGKYRKGRGGLCNDSGFCCLGVLADVIDRKRWGEPRMDERYGPTGETEWGGGFTNFLPHDILNKNIQVQLASANDDADTFEPVIAIITKYV